MTTMYVTPVVTHLVLTSSLSLVAAAQQSEYRRHLQPHCVPGACPGSGEAHLSGEVGFVR